VEDNLAIVPPVTLFLQSGSGLVAKAARPNPFPVPSKGGANKKAADENKKGVTLFEVDAFGLCPKAASPSLD